MQMKIFEIRENLWRKKAGRIDAVHKWGLPGVICPVCNQIWTTVGLEYPTVDLNDFAAERLYRDARAEPLNVYQNLRQKIADAFPQLPVLKPGAEFGSLKGKAVGGRLEGFVWRAWWTICLEASALEKLKDSDLSLPNTAKAELKFKKEEQKVYEFDLPLKGKLINAVYDGSKMKCCDGCGRDGSTKPEEILIDAASIPNNADIFRVSNFTTIILVTEKFVRAVNNLDIKGAIFKEVKTV